MAHKTDGDHEPHVNKSTKKHKSNSSASGELIIDHGEKAKKAEPVEISEPKKVEKPEHKHEEAVTHGYLKDEKETHAHSDSEPTLATNKVKDVEPPHGHETKHEPEPPHNVVVPGGVTQGAPNPAAFFRSKYHPKQHHQDTGVYGVMPEVAPQQAQYGSPVATSTTQGRSAQNKNRIIIGSFIGLFILITALTFIFGIYIPSQNRAVDNPNNVYDLPAPDQTQTEAPTDDGSSPDNSTNTDETLPQLTP